VARDRRLLAAAFPEAVATEQWFDKAPRPQDGLVSIVIPCFNQVGYTRLCVESVLEHTRMDYELVLIDNGSADETAEYFTALAGRPGPTFVRIIRNASNLGFPAACNQGLRIAQGKNIVLLNNDTIVTPGWLEGLVARLDDPLRNVGLAGPVSNGAPPPQFVESTFADAAGLNEFAVRRGAEHRGRTRLTSRLTGFCLAIRREVVEKVGVLDERFGLGFFDDDDLCFRAADAGYQLALAEDVFVHHFGSRTFKTLGVDPRELLQVNFDRFRQKWGNRSNRSYNADSMMMLSGLSWMRRPVKDPVPATPHGSVTI
jgi:GT2 family glycosyltransferase